MQLDSYVANSPIFALSATTSPEQKTRVLQRVSSLSDDTRGFLADETTAQRVVDLVTQARLEAKYGVAVAKLIGLRVLGDVASTNVPTLLEKVGVERVAAQILAGEIEKLIASVPTTEITQPSAPTYRPPSPTLDMASRRLPPLTQQIPEADSAPVPQRNIIDLRKDTATRT